jgi:hemerythrin-like metal-binding protein
MHFQAEEELMRLAHYPGLDEQQRAHRGYVRTLVRLANENALNPSALSEDLLQFLKEWWLNHILILDMGYVQLLKDK